MSPEQAKGQPVDKRADIWAFGVVLYEMLAGGMLFGGDSVPETIASVLRADIEFGKLPDGTPASVRGLVRRCLERNPKNRLHDIADARIVLDDALAGRSDEPHPAIAQRRWPKHLGWAMLGAVAAAAATLAILGSRDSSPRAANDALPRVSLRRITELPGPEICPALSPDGRQVVYASAASGNLDLYLLRVGGDRAISLTSDPAEDWGAAFSPDGERIAFRSERDGGGIFVMGATGESVRRVTSAGFDPAWSPDGKRLAYSTEAVADPNARQSIALLWVVEVESGAATRRTETDAVQPVWSPDGRRIAYWANDGGQRDVWTIGVETGEPVAVTQDAATDWSPEWSPDGRWLYFASDRGGSMNLWRVAIDSATGKAAGTPQPVTNGTRGIGFARFAKDGAQIAAMAYERSYEQTLYAVDQREPERSKRIRTLRSPSASWCSVAPGGGSLACRTSGVPEDIVVVRSDGGELRRLTSDAVKDRHPIWDPTGARLAFFSMRGGTGWDYWIMRADGSDLRRLTDIGNTGFACWSPDGRQLLVEVKNEGIWLIDPTRLETKETARRFPCPTAPETFDPIAWAPGSDRVAGVAYDGNGKATSYGIFRVDGGAFQRLPLTPAGSAWGSIGGWLRDGRTLLVRATSGVVAFDTDRGSSRPVAPAGPTDLIALSFDGSTLLVEHEVLDSDIWLLTLEQP
jgi:Tol biopolymer transport system component